MRPQLSGRFGISRDTKFQTPPTPELPVRPSSPEEMRALRCRVFNLPPTYATSKYRGQVFFQPSAEPCFERTRQVDPCAAAVTERLDEDHSDQARILDCALLWACDIPERVCEELVSGLFAREGCEGGCGGEGYRDDSPVSPRRGHTWSSHVPHAALVIVRFCVARVKGKLPGNIDIVVRLFANNDSGYLYDLFMELFDQCQSTTINLRIFGLDKVCDS